MNHPWDHFYDHKPICSRGGPGFCPTCQKFVAYRPQHCEVRRAYRLHARNLKYGVFDGMGWLGIREKFGYRSIDCEYEGSCRAVERLEFILPPEISLDPSPGAYCSTCKKDVEYTMPTRRWDPVDGTKGCEDTCHPVGNMNVDLFNFLAKIEGEPDWEAECRRHKEEE